MRLFCPTEKQKPLISDRKRKVQWIVVLRRTDSEGKYMMRGISVEQEIGFSVVQGRVVQSWVKITLG